MSIKLNDLLKINNLENVKIRFNLAGGDFDPIKAYYEGQESILTANFYNSAERKWFNEGEVVIGLLRLDGDKWLLFDISKITKDYDRYGFPHAKINSFYEHETLNEYEGFFGRLIVKIRKNWQVPVRHANEIIDEIEVSELLPESFDAFEDFPGYENVNLNWKELNEVLKRKAWVTALQNQKGVYLITDTKTNKRYVGSAYGDNMILGRWESYAKNGHGGNRELVKIVEEKGFDYIKDNFRYTILEIYKSMTPDDFIIGRESFWKEVMLSRNPKFGYNVN